MAATSYHPETGKWLTSFGRDAKAGDIHTISTGSESKLHRSGYGLPRTCEFTTYMLGEPEAVNQWGEPLFDDAKCIRVCPLDYDGFPTPENLTAIAALPAMTRWP